MTSKDGTMLFDFTDPAIFGEEQAASWWESSDTVRWAFWNFESIGEYRLICCWMAILYLTSTNYVIRSAGMSKAVFSLQRSIRFQRAVFFALINPQVAAFTKYFLPTINMFAIAIWFPKSGFNVIFIWGRVHLHSLLPWLHFHFLAKWCRLRWSEKQHHFQWGASSGKYSIYSISWAGLKFDNFC